MRISFFTFGCRTNRSESEEMAELFRAHGWSCVPYGEPSDVVVINTCTVTARSDAKARQLVRKIAGEKPEARIVVVGCGAQREPDSFRGMESVILVTGNKEKARMPELLADLGFQADGAQQLPGRPERTRPSVKIQEGCDSFCSYCIVPIVRGAPISFPHGRIIEQVRALTAEGAKEIVFTGTHLGLYNDQGIRLHDLLRQAIEIPGDFRLRISSLEPMGIAPELIELVAKHPKICPHLHISFQSFSNPVLNAMGRPYTVEFIVDLLERIRSANPRLRIGCDLIVGFPDETEALFDETCMRVRDLPVHYGHEFRFSPRPGTKAEHLAPRVPKAESIRRSEVLRQILSGKHKAFVESETGQIATVLVEDTEDRSGFTANYLRVKLEGEELLEKNRFYPARITGSENSRVSAVIVTRDP